VKARFAKRYAPCAARLCSSSTKSATCQLRREAAISYLTSNRGFAEWGEVFGDPVVATALLDRLLHHAVVVQIEGASYRMRQHADQLPEHVRASPNLKTPVANDAAVPCESSRRSSDRLIPAQFTSPPTREI
jgi:hypothetical protein